MASNGRVFFAGVGTTFVILAIGFGGGLMLAKSAVEPSAERQSTANVLPPARVILPASAVPATPPQPPGQIAEPENSPRAITSQDAPQAIQMYKQTERAQRRKARAEEQRKKLAERKARREAARMAIQQQERQQRQRQQVGIVAFGPDEDARGIGGFFGN